jgi:hypothetical protein
MAALIAEMRQQLQGLSAALPAVAESRAAALDAVDQLETAVRAILEQFSRAPEQALAVSVPILRLTGLVLGGWLLAKSADIAARQLTAGAADADFLRGKLAAARFYAAHVLPQAAALSRVVVGGSASVLEAEAALF